MSLGARLRALRKANGYTLREVAARTGVSPAFLSLVERDRTSPSVAQLMRIARCLGTNLASLFEQDLRGQAVVRADRRVGLLRRESNGTVHELLAPVTNRSMECLLIHMEPGGVSGSLDAGHGGEEFIFVLRGKVGIRFPDGEHELGEGDSIYFDAGQPHCCVNLGGMRASMISIITPATL